MALWDSKMHEVDAIKSEHQRQQLEAHLAERGQIYLDIWKVGINTFFPHL